MSDKIYDVPPEWKKRAFIDEAKYQAMYRQSVEDPDGFWAEQAKRIDWIKPFTKVKNTIVRARQRLDQLVRGRHAQRLRQLHRPASRRRAPTRSRSSGRATTRRGQRKITYRELHDAGLPLRQRAEGARRQEGRPRHDLHADDPRGGLRDARLRADRRGPFGRVRRLLAGLAGRPHRGLPTRRSSSPPTRACAAAARFR